MKIALLGAPGAGKTDLARRLARNLNRDNTSRDNAEFWWATIDGYVDDLAKRTGRVYGLAADFPHNAQIMGERWTREAEALQKGLSTITCGTIYETLVHAALTRLTPPADEQELMAFYTETRTAMQFFGLMEQMTFNYDALFFLPLIDGAEHDWPAVINAKLPEVLEGAFRYAVPLAGNLRQDTKHALGIIRHLRDQLTAVEAEAADDQ